LSGDLVDLVDLLARSRLRTLFPEGRQQWKILPVVENEAPVKNRKVD